jgi:hypothetical protein
MFSSIRWPFVQFSSTDDIWVVLPCEFQYIDSPTGQRKKTVKHFTLEALTQLCGVATAEDLISGNQTCSGLNTLRGYLKNVNASSIAEFEESVIRAAVEKFRGQTIKDGRTVGQAFARYLPKLPKGSAGPAPDQIRHQQKRFRCPKSERGQKRKHSLVTPVSDERRLLRQLEYARSRCALQPFIPTCGMTHVPHVDGNPHCLLEAFHMAARTAVPRPRDMEWVMEEFKCDDVLRSRRQGYSMRTLRCALGYLATEKAIDPVIVVKSIAKPHGGWSWAALTELTSCSGVYLWSCVVDVNHVPSRHFVVADSFTAEFGDSLAASTRNLDVAELQAESWQHKACSIWAVVEVFQLMCPQVCCD